MPVFNGQRHIQESLQSALASDYPNFEVVILDDGSTDQSRDLIDRMSNKYVRVISNSANQGLVSARRRLMEEADGDLLAWLDQDDIAFAKRLAIQSDFLRSHKDVAVCGSYVQIQYHARDGGHRFRVRRPPTRHRDVRAHLPFENPINFSTSMMHRGRFERTGLSFRSNFGNTLDYDLWSRLAEQSNLENIPQILGRYRVHEHQTSVGGAGEIMMQQAWVVQQEILDRNFGLSTGSSMDHIHFKMTMDKPSLTSLSHLETLSDWINTLIDANRHHRSYPEENLQKALARYWFGSLRHLDVSGAGTRGMIGVARAYRSSGLADRRAIDSLYSWCRTSLMRDAIE